jgi:hypothetical protein
MTPYQEAQMDLQRQNLELNRGNVEYTRSKDLEAKEKEKALGQAISEYYIAKDDDGRNAALSKAAMIDPKATSDFYKRIKTREALDKGWTTDTGRLWEIYNDQNQPEENRMLAGMILKSKASDPNLKGSVAYQSEMGKQAAQAGLPYGISGQPVQAPVNPLPSTFGGYMQEATQQAQVMPMQAQPIPTAAQLAADKKRAETRAEGEEKFAKELSQTQANIANYDKLLKDIEDNADLLGPLGYISYKGGELTNGLFGMESEDRKKYAMIYRQVGEMRSRLIARAKAAGQTGINTAKEIELATAGITFTMTAPSLTGAIEELKRNDIMLSEEIARHYGMGEQISQPQEENVISAEEWFNQGRN